MRAIKNLSLFAAMTLATATAQAEDNPERFEAVWAQFGNDFYDVAVDGKPKVSASSGGMQRVCFDVRAAPKATAAKDLAAALSKIQDGDRPLHVGKATALGPKLDKTTSERWAEARELDLGDGRGSFEFVPFLDWTSEFDDAPGKVDLLLPGVREIVVRNGGRVIARIPFLVSLQAKGEGLADKATIYVPKEPCSEPLDSAKLKASTTAKVEVIDLAPVLARANAIAQADGTEEFDF